MWFSEGVGHLMSVGLAVSRGPISNCSIVKLLCARGIGWICWML